MPGEEFQGPLAGKICRRFIITGAVVAVEPVIGIIDIDRHVRVRCINGLHISHGNVRIKLSKMQNRRHPGGQIIRLGDAAAVVS